MRRFALCALTALAITPAQAQFIGIKTVPLATGDQFLIFPSRNLGFGGLSLSVRDPMLDPFVNPAKAARLPGSQVFGAPSFYNISESGGAGRTLPAGGLFSSDKVFGGLVLTFQQLEASERPQFCCLGVDARGFSSVAPPQEQTLSGRSHINQYAFGMVGTRLREGLSIGASGMFGSLNAIDGIEHLYPNAFSLDQNGYVADVRLGLLDERVNGRAVEAMLVFSTVDMVHDVGNLDLIWDTLSFRPVRRNRIDRNTDVTHTYGLHLGYQGAARATGWRPAALATANYKLHPRIPNYQLMSIPRDPGYSFAYNFGVGIGTDEGPGTVGIEAVLEPIWSRTWANADRVIPLTGRPSLQPGDRSIENAFVFHNAHFRAGVQREIEFGPRAAAQKLDVQLGFAMRSINYRLVQRDYALGTARTQREDWIEATPTWGLTLRFPELEIRYVGRQTSGTGRPGVAGSFSGRAGIEVASAAPDILLAPSSALTLTDALVRTHQIAVTVPLR